MLDIKLVELQYMNCYEMLIATYAKTYHRNYELMFTGSWGFKYQKPLKVQANIKLGNRISTGAVLHYDYLEKYHGVRCKEYSDLIPEHMLLMIKEGLRQSQPSMIYMSNYWYTWSGEYKEGENGLHHAILVTGIDEQAKHLICVDATHKQEGALLLIEDFMRGCNDKLMTFEMTQQNDVAIDWEDVLSYAIGKLKRGTERYVDFEDMNLFAQEVRDALDLKNEIGKDNKFIWVAPLIFEISGRASDIYNFRRMLIYLKDLNELPQLEEVIKRFESILLSWECIRGMFIKGYYTKSNPTLMNRIADRIEAVAEEEVQAAQIIETLINHQTVNATIIVHEDTYEMRLPLTEVMPIDIDSLLNNQCFRDPNDHSCKVNMNGLGYFMYLDEEIKKTNWQADEMRFKTKSIDGVSYDSLVCTGQMINVPLEKFNQIMFMGCSDLGCFTGKVTMQYEDGTTHDIPLSFSEHNRREIVFNEKIVWSGQCGFENAQEHAFDSKLFGKSYSLMSHKKLKSIKLPDCPNMILFAISLGKTEDTVENKVRREKHEVAGTC